VGELPLGCQGTLEPVRNDAPDLTILRNGKLEILGKLKQYWSTLQVGEFVGNLPVNQPGKIPYSILEKYRTFILRA